MERCEKCGQRIRTPRVKSEDIWKEIHILLELDSEDYDTRIHGVMKQKELFKLRDAIKAKLGKLAGDGK